MKGFQSTLPARGATPDSPIVPVAGVFQSTLPARGATASSLAASWSTPNFNPRSPRGERRVNCSAPCLNIGFQSTLPARGATDCLAMRIRPRGISIHAPREGSDRGQIPRRKPAQFISIHAPREGSDKWTRTHSQTRRNFNPRSPRGERPGSNSSAETCAIYFNPRSPRGERQVDADALADAQKFQSTLPARGATSPSTL